MVDRVFIQIGITAHFPVLVAQGAVSGLAGIAALRWTPFPIVTTVVHEILSDISPRLASLLTGSDGERMAKTPPPSSGSTPRQSAAADKQ